MLTAMHPPADSGPCIYILRCGDDSLYTGAAKDLARRIADHHGKRGARYVRARLPVELVYWEPCADWPSALRREYQIKQLTRLQKERLLRRRTTGC